MTSDQPVEQAGATHADQGLDRRVLLVAGVVVLGAIMSILDMTIVGVAQNTFQSQWNATPATVAWTMTGYTLALAAVIPVTGWAADRFGTKRLYMISTALFVLGSVMCAMAGGITELIIFRVIQGLGGGMLMPLGMMILTRAAGPERIGRVMAVLGIPMLLGPIGGPILGGWLIESYSWHWIFLINLPIGVIAIIYAAIVLDKDETSPSESFDIVGFLLLSPGLALFLFGVSSIPEAQATEGTMFTARVLVSAIIGVVLIGAFVFWALRAKLPLLDLRLFKNRNMTVAMITFTCFAIAFFGSMLLYSQYFIGVRGTTTLMAGLLLAPQGLGAMVTMPIAGTLTDKMGPGKFVMSGLALIVVGLIAFATIDADTSYWIVCGSLFVQGLGMGMTMMPTMSAAIRTLEPHSISRGSTLTNIVQQISASIGTAVFSVIFTNLLKSAGPLIPAPGQPAPVAQGAAAFGFNSSPSAREQGAKLLGGQDKFDAFLQQALPDAAHAFAHSWVVAAALVAICLIPAFFLPRSHDADTGAAERAVMVH
ncbi:DHA2 family efflux MFS transporter permease subunit [Tsukamurella sp. 8F]|uniref:DHA2 family efflux MFS transporter permease subunit n=1 Tax=unclassified Tsukamurella TaxID=2633480 RepID=UPI0023B943E2|nr:MULTISPECIES: DHA2 family efflux MFS transporter permease subunit [unclassified Tsukamurella]MDF0528358.1 DHA2 family efflux MFS transporter permease subunit [Tsukamurella sp. 8J]MDF0586183.1 DHA2 family efflux MFS transporter permease subunit [Tsukamurella sp. 8F]